MNFLAKSFQFVRKGTVNPLMYGQNMPVPGFDSYLPPRAEHFDEGAWETVLVHEYWDAKYVPKVILAFT